MVIPKEGAGQIKNSISPNYAKGLTVNLESLCALKPDELAECGAVCLAPTSCDEPAHGRSLYYKRLSRDPDLNAIHTRIRRPCGAGRGATNGKQ